MSVSAQYFYAFVFLLVGISIGLLYHIKKYYLNKAYFDIPLFILIGLCISFILNQLFSGILYPYILIFIALGFIIYHFYFLKNEEKCFIIISYYVKSITNLLRKFMKIVFSPFIIIKKTINKRKNNT